MYMKSVNHLKSSDDLTVLLIFDTSYPSRSFGDCKSVVCCEHLLVKYEWPGHDRDYGRLREQHPPRRRHVCGALPTPRALPRYLPSRICCTSVTLHGNANRQGALIYAHTSSRLSVGCLEQRTHVDMAPMHLYASVSHRGPRRIGINNLPADVLLLILRNIFSASRVPRMGILSPKDIRFITWLW